MMVFGWTWREYYETPVVAIQRRFVVERGKAAAIEMERSLG